MAKHLASEREALERIMSNGGANPIRLSYGLLQSITDNFSENRVIGEGGFGVVYLGVLQNWNIAVKNLKISKDLDDKLIEAEIDPLMKVKHKNIVRFVGYCIYTEKDPMEIGGKFRMVEVQQKILCFEYLPKGNLRRYIKEKLPNEYVWYMQYHIIKGICEGLKCLHDKNICHMDLKPENILLDADMIPKITDFGLSRSIDEGKSKIYTQILCGTPGYVPPEGIESGEISFRSDIYALGIIVMELLTGQKNVEGDNGHRSPEYGEQVESCVEIALTCLGDDKYKRPSIDEIIEMLNKMVPPPGTSIHQTMMSSCMREGNTIRNELLDVYPHQLRFPISKPNGLTVSSPLRLTNKTDAEVAFRLLPAEKENHIVSELHGILPPSSTRTYLLWMEKQPPASSNEFKITLEYCMALDYIAEEDFEDHFSPENPDLHEAALMAVIGAVDMTMTKVIYRADHAERILKIVVHPTEPWIMAGFYDGRVIIWDYHTQERVLELKICSSYVLAVDFVAREHHWLLAGDAYGKIHVHAYNTNEHVKTFDAHEGSNVQHLSVHPSKPLLLSASGPDGVIKLWDWRNNWKRIRTFKAHANSIARVKFAPMDSDTFVSVAVDGKIKFWKTGTARCISEIDCQGEEQFCVDFFQPPGADRHYMITCAHKRAKIWDLETYTCIRTISGLQEIEGIVGAIHDCVPDRQLLVAALRDSAISLYNFSTGRWCDNAFDLKLRLVRNFIYVEGIKCVAIGCEGGIAMMEIN